MDVSSMLSNSSSQPRRFPNWEEVYATSAIENLPWYFRELDPDLKTELELRQLHSGTFLDLGTGPGTQAIELARRGFNVAGADLSQSAITQARALATCVDFFQDDILKTTITKRFDYVFDRGCFHTMTPENRATYVNHVSKICGKLFFLKCFSNRQEIWDHGPYRFSLEDIKEEFGPAFQILSHQHTVYQGTLETQPAALFVTLAPT